MAAVFSIKKQNFEKVEHFEIFFKYIEFFFNHYPDSRFLSMITYIFRKMVTNIYDNQNFTSKKIDICDLKKITIKNKKI